jgi:TrmH family RNA methyltransferase
MKPLVVLVEPRSAGNVGAAARALENLDAGDLVLVNPHCDPRGEEARRLAVEAAGRLLRARVVGSLDEALAGSRVSVGATARTGKQRRPHYRVDTLAEALRTLPGAETPALVFGREDRGLTDTELDRCTHVVYLPASPGYTSFNLAQAVLLVVWELRRAGWGPADSTLDPPATHESREAMLRHLQRAWVAIGFLQGEATPSMMRKFRRLFGRAGLTDDEVRVLRGVAHQTLWAARAAGLDIPPEE